MRLILYILLLPVYWVLAQGIHDWETLSYMNDVTDVQFYDNQIWVATTGGAYSFNISDSTAQKYTNIDGLISMNLSALTTDQHGNIIFAASDGNISVYNTESDLWNSLAALNGQNITDVFSKEDTLWVAANNGVGVFLYARNQYEFRDFYDNLPIDPEISTKVICYNNQVFFATKNGLLYAPSNFVKFNLKSTENWKFYSTDDILPYNDVRTLVEINDTLYIGTANGVTRLSKDSWHDNGRNWSNGTVNNIVDVNNTVYFFRNSDFYSFNGSTWEQVNDLGYNVASLVKDGEENLWFGFQNNGIANWHWNKSFLIDGPGSNHVGIITKDPQNNIWISAGKYKVTPREGFYKYDLKNWTNYKFSGGKWVWKNQTAYIYSDRSGDIWIGSWPGGMAVLSETSVNAFHKFSEEGQLIISNAQGEEIISLPPISAENVNCLSNARIQGTDLHLIITHFTEDNNGNLWFSNYLADDLNSIVMIPVKNDGSYSMTCSDWLFFGSNIGLSLNEGQISSLLFDDAGRLWVGTFENKLLIIDFNETLQNTNDDQVFRIGTSDNLYSNTILGLAKDHDGVIWIGTDAGLNSYDGQNFYKHVGETGPIENKINQITVDDFNNKWFATDGGMSILEGDKSPWESGAWTHYTVENSGLPHEIVNSVLVDAKRGEAYIGTEAGLSIFRGSFAEIKTDYGLLKGGPNPFFLDNRNRVFTIKNLVVNSTVKILNINGRLVRILSEENGMVRGGRAGWDGRDEENNLVASGIYLYMVYTEDGVVGNGKISVIRK